MESPERGIENELLDLHSRLSLTKVANILLLQEKYDEFGYRLAQLMASLFTTIIHAAIMYTISRRCFHGR